MVLETPEKEIGTESVPWVGVSFFAKVQADLMKIR